MMISKVLFLVLGLLVTYSNSYKLVTNYTGSSFFDGWTFFNSPDPTHGTVNYVTKDVAQQKGYIKILNNQKVYIGCDNTSVLKSGGRESVRITTKQWFNSGLFLMDLTHMPTGCSTWPAWWLVGPSWPTHGEIDIIEGINVNKAVLTTLHTDDGCSMENESTSSFTGTWAPGSNKKPATNCYIKAPGQYNNQGCSIAGADGSFGGPFNDNDGGVYATEWTSSFIRMWFFPRQKIPGDIQAGNPKPDNWGTPYAYFQLGSNCPPSHFTGQQIVINLTFCGDFAGGKNFKDTCPQDGDCSDFVRKKPNEFKEAYWMITYVAVYTQ